MGEAVPIPPELLAAFHDVANDAAREIGDACIAFAENVSDPRLKPGEVFFAAVTGATTGALKVLKATAEAGMLSDAQGSFDTLLRQMADIWGQLHAEAPASGTIQ